jgi:hypothetical protein
MIASDQCDVLATNLLSRSGNMDNDYWHIEGCSKGFSSKKVYYLLSEADIAPALVLWT